MIQNIVFDLGRVLISFEPREWLNREYGNKDGAFLYEQFCLSPYWVELDRGTKTLAEVRELLCRRFPEKDKLLTDCIGRYMEMLTPIPEGTAILERLVSQGYTAFYLTNYHGEAFRRLEKSLPWFRRFQGGVCSAFCGLTKPDPAIFRLLCDKENIQPENTLFLDDTEENIRSAEALGFQTIHVESHEGLAEKIQLKLP